MRRPSPGSRFIQIILLLFCRIWTCGSPNGGNRVRRPSPGSRFIQIILLLFCRIWTCGSPDGGNRVRRPSPVSRRSGGSNRTSWSTGWENEKCEYKLNKFFQHKMYKDVETKTERGTPDFLVAFGAKIFTGICLSTAVCLRKLLVGTVKLYICDFYLWCLLSCSLLRFQSRFC